MVLESTIICVDNSEFMRNGDFLPTRLQAQQDAVGLIAQSKLRSNPESNVGLLTLSGLEVMVTLTTDSGKILAKLHAMQPKGELQLLSGIKIAHLALKHRLGKNHKTRIVVFVGSPIEAEEKELIKIAKKLKKEKVSVDVVSFGEDDCNKDILGKFIETVNGRDGKDSHMLSIPTGPHLSDALVSSAIVQGEDGSGAVPAGSGFEFGVDPNEDPELALALRVSMEEQRARQEAESGATAGGADAGGEAPAADAATAAVAGADAMEEDPVLARALAMSVGGSASSSAAPATPKAVAAEPDLSAMTEDEQIAYAMRMSMQEEAEGGDSEEKMDIDEASQDKNEDDYSEAMNDPAFLQSVLESLPGVDPQSDAVRQAVGAMSKSSSSKKDSEKKDDKDGKK
jgi:26S proteasome regulatory subunit N10